jgi:PAS domain-containing protein
MAENPTYEELKERVQALERSESERMLTEEKLIESEKRYSMLVEHTDDLITRVGGWIGCGHGSRD